MIASPASIVMCMSNSTSESQDEDVDSMSMCQSNPAVPPQCQDHRTRRVHHPQRATAT